MELTRTEEECTLAGLTSYVASAVVSADGRVIVSGSYGKTIKIWNMQEHRRKAHSQEHKRIRVECRGKINCE